MSDNLDKNSSGIGVFGLLGVAFVVLKLCGVIDWSWWWVTAPFWGGFVIVVAMLIFGVIFAGSTAGILVLSDKISNILSERKRKKKTIISTDHEVVNNED